MSQKYLVFHKFANNIIYFLILDLNFNSPYYSEIVLKYGLFNYIISFWYVISVTTSISFGAIFQQTLSQCMEPWPSFCDLSIQRDSYGKPDGTVCTQEDYSVYVLLNWSTALCTTSVTYYREGYYITMARIKIGYVLYS